MTWRAERSPELPAVARHADLVWEVGRPDGWRGILHIELQTKVEADIGERLAEYAIRLWRRDHLPVRSLVVFLREARTVPASPFVIPWDSGATLRCHYGVVRLWERPQEEVLGTPHVALWPLASLMAAVTAESTLAVAERIVQSPLAAEERRDLTGLLFVLAGSRVSPSAIMEALGRSQMIDDLLKDNSFVQVMMEEGERRMARAALEGRHGPLSEELRTALRSADEVVLLALMAHLGTDSLEQVRARLGLV
jgi:hypothetical protein